MDLRERIPTRRSDPKSVSDYHQYKDDLREDFKCRCGYCNDHDYFRTTDYQIDHFVPRTQMKRIELTDYSNLVYSCRSCNRAKSNKWPTGDENMANNGSEGFIDPCDKAFDEQFSRNERGEVIPKTQLGIWMWKALNFGNPVHSVVWKLERIKTEIDKLQVIADVYPSDTTVSIKLNDLNKGFRSYLDELRGGAPIF